LDKSGVEIVLVVQENMFTSVETAHAEILSDAQNDKA
jgi:hypothetical protein